ncbi:MAG: tripartite tricarboxylate transporter TctB family protein [Armatimonadota bacterium]|nr:tripartite tricarboxylate transporter TctB family protein [Armatimonadota bacterium]
MRRADLLTGLGLFIVAIIYFHQSLGIVRGFASDRLGPAFFPRLLAGSLAALAVVLMVRAGRGRSDPSPLPPTRGRLLGAVLGLLVAYALVLPRVGFLLATPVLLAALLGLLGRASSPGQRLGWAGAGVAAVAMTLALYVVFGRALHVLLPQGPLP